MDKSSPTKSLLLGGDGPNCETKAGFTYDVRLIAVWLIAIKRRFKNPPFAFTHIRVFVYDLHREIKASIE